MAATAGPAVQRRWVRRMALVGGLAAALTIAAAAAIVRDPAELLRQLTGLSEPYSDNMFTLYQRVLPALRAVDERVPSGTDEVVFLARCDALRQLLADPLVVDHQGRPFELRIDEAAGVGLLWTRGCLAPPRRIARGLSLGSVRDGSWFFLFDARAFAFGEARALTHELRETDRLPWPKHLLDGGEHGGDFESGVLNHLGYDGAPGGSDFFGWPQAR